MEIDVTHVMLRGTVRQAIQAWLEQNVGPYYGEVNISLLRSASVGDGWEFVTQTQLDDHATSINWIVDIADERLAAMFMLRFS